MTQYPSWQLDRIISGGQTGADRAALNWALLHGIPHGGWCPLGKLAEDGILDERYCLQETPSATYEQRTEWNVRDSDGTVIFSLSPRLSGGSRFTLTSALKYRKPYIHLIQQEQHFHATHILFLEFLDRYNIHVLNIAGPRASEEPAIADFVYSTLNSILLPA